MDKYPKSKKAIQPKLNQAINSKGKTLKAAVLAGMGVIRVELHEFNFNEGQKPPNPNWVTKTKTVTPPAGWRQAYATVAAWGFDLFPSERPITYLGASCGVRLTGSNLEVSASAICRDINFDDPWKGNITVLLTFLG